MSEKIEYSKPSIPDKYVGEFTVTGNWEWTLTGLNSPMELYPDTLWASGKSGAYAKYEPQITAVGRVRISAYMIGYDNWQDKNMEYEIHYSGGVDKKYVDLSEYKSGESRWLVLGTYEFDGSGNEYVKLNRISNENNTRASTLRFEILNSADEEKNDAWQYLYVGPDRYTKRPSGMAKLNKFNDISECKYNYAIETLAYLEIIESETNEFRPDEYITVNDFSNWFYKLTNIDIIIDWNKVNYYNACILAMYFATKSGRNLEWLGYKGNDPIEFVNATEMLGTEDLNLCSDEILTRAEAAAFIKGYYHTFIAAGVDKDNWRLSFNDEFNGKKINKKVWDCENAVSYHILSSRWEENVKVADGKLHLITKKEKIDKCPNLDWTTASVSVKPDVFSQYGGYWEASIKINASGGLNNAFWMAGSGNEIDIVEAHYKNAVHTNYHYNGTQYSENFNAPFDLSRDFHIYALAWNEDELIYYFDGKKISRKKNLAAHSPLYPFFSTAVLNWAGKIDDSADGCEMEVEWVRIYMHK